MMNFITSLSSETPAALAERAQVAVNLEINSQVALRNIKVQELEQLGEIDSRTALTKAKACLKTAMGNVGLANSNSKKYLQELSIANNKVDAAGKTVNDNSELIVELKKEIQKLTQLRESFKVSDFSSLNND